MRRYMQRSVAKERIRKGIIYRILTTASCMWRSSCAYVQGVMKKISHVRRKLVGRSALYAVGVLGGDLAR